jgi:hypothetical protein
MMIGFLKKNVTKGGKSRDPQQCMKEWKAKPLTNFGRTKLRN